MSSSLSLLILQETRHIINPAGCFPWGLFFSCHLGLHPGLLGSWLPPLQICGPPARHQDLKPSRKLLVNSLDGPTPDAARPIRRQWFIWCLSSSVMKREYVGSPGCWDEAQGGEAPPAPARLGSRLETELESEGPDTSFLQVAHVTPPERETGPFPLHPAAEPVLHSNCLVASLLFGG